MMLTTATCNSTAPQQAGNHCLGPMGDMMNYRPSRRATVPASTEPRPSDRFWGHSGSSRLVSAVVLFLGLALICARPAHAQSHPTADRVGDLQVGGGFVFANSQYDFQKLNFIGGAFYTTFDFKGHFGAEGDIRQVDANQGSTSYERTYEVGARYFLRYGRLRPYAKILYGRGVYNFPDNVANLAYNLYTYGGGADFRLTRSINLRADYEYQNWLSFPLGTLHPSVITIGAAYHFHE